ncbi:carboxypeptidase-like regulatory domain-containing protein [Litchfieldella xinjiangensis]|uniref:carboxypeptidase-like regulatory domain-containing protein n=1 Tax=Litchfieldella xinjiangensis TaxID=1166948 RepID=UPI0005BA0C76|nr:carboxypeptidase-like regulatory domain-containing protein [Halomonas xinjiangensis]
MLRWTGLLLSVLFLAGCQAISPDTDSTPPEVIERETEPGVRPDRPGRVARQVEFPEQEYAALEKQGNATISGELYYTTPAGERIRGAHETVSIAPVTTYSAEAAEAALAGKQVEPADPRAQAYTHTVRTDSQGRFTASGLPAGDYYVAGSVRLPGSEQRSPIILHQVHVGSGQTKRVTLKR